MMKKMDDVFRWIGAIFSGALVPVIPLLQNHLKLRKEPANRCAAVSGNRKAEAIKHVKVYLSMILEIPYFGEKNGEAPRESEAPT